MSDYSNHTRLLTHGSIWLDEQKRTIVIIGINWANTVNVGSFELLVIPANGKLMIATRPAAQIEGYVRSGKMQYCKDCERAETAPALKAPHYAGDYGAIGSL